MKKKHKRKLPKRLYIIRHAKSLPNLRLAEAEAAGAEHFELPMPEHLAPIVPEGHNQVADLAAWFAKLPAEEQPRKIVSSTHTRTRETSAGIVTGSGLIIPVHHDERWIEKKWGIIGGLTHSGFEKRFPHEHAKRVRIGEFRYRPPQGGESLRDVKKRIKPACEELLTQHDDENVALVTHSQIIIVLRQLIEGLTEREAAELDERQRIPNCAVCVYVRKGNRLVLEREYFVAPNLVADPPAVA